MDTPIIFWIIFNAFVLIMLALDLGVFHRKSHEGTVKETLKWTFVWIFLALIFNAIIYFWRGQKQALEYFTVYLVEKALSVDIIFAFIMIFTYFQIPAKYQHKVLFWSIIGALLKSIPSMGYVVMLIGILFYVYAILGVFVFGETDPMHFGDLHHAFVTLFKVLTLEGWTDIMNVHIFGPANN